VSRVTWRTDPGHQVQAFVEEACCEEKGRQAGAGKEDSGKEKGRRTQSPAT
jgi:hypothetical protein